MVLTYESTKDQTHQETGNTENVVNDDNTEMESINTKHEM